jgi:hypothetical protein
MWISESICGAACDARLPKQQQPHLASAPHAGAIFFDRRMALVDGDLLAFFVARRKVLAMLQASWPGRQNAARQEVGDRRHDAPVVTMSRSDHVAMTMKGRKCVRVS